MRSQNHQIEAFDNVGRSSMMIEEPEIKRKHNVMSSFNHDRTNVEDANTILSD